jgi:selenocysteine lyase/cysteine desulfurase
MQDKINEREKVILTQALRRFKEMPNVLLLGNNNLNKIAIFSFIIYTPNRTRLLHHHFVALLLNDLFGI